MNSLSAAKVQRSSFDSSPKPNSASELRLFESEKNRNVQMSGCELAEAVKAVKEPHFLPVPPGVVEIHLGHVTQKKPFE